MKSGELALWRSVVLQAKLDATLIPDHANKERLAARRHARLWLREGGKDFHDVCLFAGIESHALREILSREAYWWEG